MARGNKRRAAALALALLATAQTPAPPQRSYLGLQGLLIVGAHRDVAGSQYGVGAGPLVQGRFVAQRFAASFEGIPVVSIPNTRPSIAYGQATPKLGIFNGQFEYALDARRSFWLGLGETIYNQRTPLPAKAQSVSSRLAGVRYAARYVHAFNAAHWAEAFIGVAPTLSGSDVYAYLSGAPNFIKPERASEIDASLTFGYRKRSTEWLVGLRTLNFAAKFVLTGEGADRNVGIGPVVEYRHLFP